jgi:hypothetical protein
MSNVERPTNSCVTLDIGSWKLDGLFGDFLLFKTLEEYLISVDIQITSDNKMPRVQCAHFPK